MNSGYTLKTRLTAYAHLMRWDRPIGTALLLWPSFWALWIASNGQPSLHWMIIFLIGGFLTRSAGCVINDYADRFLDPEVTRTRNRPLARQIVTPREALILFVFLCLLSAQLLWFLNERGIFVAGVSVVLMTLYPFTKRYTNWPQLFLSAAFGCGVWMAFAVYELPWTSVSLSLYGISLLWPLAYDTMYAMADRAEDQKLPVGSSAIALGKWDRGFVGMLQILILGLFLQIGFCSEFEWPFYFCLSLGACTFMYQHYLIRQRDAQHCFQAFLNNHWFGLLMFIGIAGSYFLA